MSSRQPRAAIAPLAIFLLTAGVGVWTAYNPQNAGAKFWQLVGAAAVYLLLVWLLPARRWRTAGGLGFAGALLAGSYLVLKLLSIDLFRGASDVAGGVFAILLPFLLAWSGRAWRARKKTHMAFGGAASGFMLLGLAASGERGAWLGVAAASLLWGLWLGSGYAARRTIVSRNHLFAAGALAPLVLGLAAAFAFRTQLLGFVNTTPALGILANRLQIAGNAVDLLGDFPFTGGGLAAFPGLYSRYILAIPYLFITHSHNLFLNIAIGQGWPGLAAFLVIVFVGVKNLLSPSAAGSPHADLLRWAAGGSLLAMCIHGLFEDPLYSSPAIFLLFVPAAMCHALPPGEKQPEAGAPRKQWLLAGGVVMLFALALSFYSPIRASWYANLGTVQMSKIELGGWPAIRADAAGATTLAQPQALFQKAVSIYAPNRSAQHRLGLLAVKNRDYTAAAAHLQIAHDADNTHRGVIKELGYAYVWIGEPEKGAALLADIPEASYEMGVYAGWWKKQNREDLAVLAREMSEQLKNSEQGLGTGE